MELNMNARLLFIHFIGDDHRVRYDPDRPTLAWMPAGKPFEVFVADDTVCRQFADRQNRRQSQTAATQDTVSGAAIGSAVGAIAGAAIGSRRR